MVGKVSNTQATVLITGDSGTGKELIALALHAHSDRRERLFCPSTVVRCLRHCWKVFFSAT